jgi:hypothetical protein
MGEIIGRLQPLPGGGGVALLIGDDLDIEVSRALVVSLAESAFSVAEMVGVSAGL